MSDQSQGPGWWQASDLKWYPPDQVPGTGGGTAAPSPSPTSSWDPPATSWNPPPMAGPPPLGPPSPYGPPSGPGYGPPAGSAYGMPGYSPYGGYAMGAPGSGLPSVNGLATASLVCGILCLVLFFCFFLGLPLGVAGAAMGGIAMSRISKGTADPGSRGLALAGTICSGLGLAGGLFIVVLIYAN